MTLGAEDLVAVVLAAGAGTRLRPLTDILPKALCPVNNIALVDHALERAPRNGYDVAVNVHHGRALMERHLAGRAHLSIEEPGPLGTAGALGNLRGWIDGRDVLVLNADGWHTDDLESFVRGWDRTRIRLLGVRDQTRGDFGSIRYCGAALMPSQEISKLEPEPSGLYEMSWGPAWTDGTLDLVVSTLPFFDCGTLSDYHAANMAASGGENVVGAGAIVDGTIERTVLWPGVHVARDEHLVDAVRPRDGTTLHATATGACRGV